MSRSACLEIDSNAFRSLGPGSGAGDARCELNDMEECPKDRPVADLHESHLHAAARSSSPYSLMLLRIIITGHHQHRTIGAFQYIIRDAADEQVVECAVVM